jgi:hypothetical protein
LRPVYFLFLVEAASYLAEGGLLFAVPSNQTPALSK